MCKSRFILPLLCLLLGPALLFGADVDFNRDVREILSNHCFQCHGPDDNAREAELRLDTRAGALASRDGQAAIVPKRPAESALVARITSTDADLQMPPPETGKPLSAEQIDILQRWVKQGATYAKHWSFEPVQRPQLPEHSTSGQATNGVDGFIFETLDARGLTPSAVADRYTLIRRVYLDLLGLAPEIEAADAFVHDTRPDAYSRLLDRVLSSPHFGERWGRHWLDQARYADSHGYTNDNERSMWPYRDWVIAAFNRDLPFDRFTIEQLAGDLLDEPTMAQQVATGFHRNTLINSEGGTKADQFRDEQVKDRVDTTGTVWMSLSVGCAKCHTHKFDPLTQHEYYQLYAFFNSTADTNSVTPILKVPTIVQTERLADLTEKQQELQERLASDADRPSRQQAWEAAVVARAQQATEAATKDDEGWTVLELSGKSLGGAELTSQPDQSLLVSGKSPRDDEYHATANSPLTKVRSVRLEVLTDESLPKTGPGRASNGNFVLSEFWFRTGDGRELRFARASAEHSQPQYEVAKSIDGKSDTGWAINSAPEGTLNRNRTAWFVLPEPLEVELNHALTFKMQFDHPQAVYSLGRFRISISSDEWIDNPDDATLAKLIAIPEAKRSGSQRQKLTEAFLKQDEKLAPVKRALDTTTKDIDAVRRSIASTMVLQELEQPRQTHLQIRGDFLRTSDVVVASVPEVLPQIGGSQGRLTRLDLAHWLMQSDHPLTARVRVNRIWMRLFGRGLVETENDFGIQGTLPTHPALLDWVADEFQQQQWSTKRLLRVLMSSSTYRQSSHSRSELEAVDARNLYLGRQSRLRVEAEIVRDLALAASGYAAARIGGPSVYPPQPQGVYAFTQRKKNWRTSDGADRYRRGMYTYFYRSAPYPMLATFDVPKFNTTCTRRDRSNTPLQSLTIANSEAMFELAGYLAERIRQFTADGDQVNQDRERIVFGFRLCMVRPPSAKEQQLLTHYLQHARQQFDTEAGAWTAVARVLINLDEFITRE